jgi:hypothetical protein
MEGGFVLDRWNVVAGGVDAPMVVPVHPFERRELDVVPCAPRTFTVDELGLVEELVWWSLVTGILLQGSSGTPRHAGIL